MSKIIEDLKRQLNQAKAVMRKMRKIGHDFDMIVLNAIHNSLINRECSAVTQQAIMMAAYTLAIKTAFCSDHTQEEMFEIMKGLWAQCEPKSNPEE